MESSETRRQSDVLPSINYSEFERTAREGAQFHQRHPSIARASISTASPISPTTLFGPPGPLTSYPQPSANGIHTPPDSRRTSDDPPGRQSLPSLHEVFDNKPGSFSAPSPMQTPPIGAGSFPPSRTNSLAMPRSQPSDSHPSNQLPHGYIPASQSSHQPPSQPPPQPASQPPPPSPHGQEATPYTRHDSHGSARSLPPNPYSQAQPPPPIPALLHPPEAYHPPPLPPPPPASAAPTAAHQHPPAPSPAYQPHHPQYPPHPPPQSSSPHYGPHPAPSPFTNGSGPPPPPPASTQYPPSYQQPQQHPHVPQHQPPHPQPQPHPPYQPAHPPQLQFPYPPGRESGYSTDRPGPPGPPPPSKGVKRGSGYGGAIERALSISAIRRDMDSIKEHSARIYHIVNQYQEMTPGGQQSYPGGLQASMQEFAEALQRSYATTDALNNCNQVFQDLSQKELAEQNAHKVNPRHGSEYGTDDGQSYADETRSNSSQQPEKKMRRGRAAPPGRCHSCHRAETPEWRRGPDGARTLCNACGLHYAKLTRKLSKSTMGATSLGARKNSPLP